MPHLLAQQASGLPGPMVVTKFILTKRSLVTQRTFSMQSARLGDRLLPPTSQQAPTHVLTWIHSLSTASHVSSPALPAQPAGR